MLVCDILISPVPDDILSRDSVGIRRPITSCGGDALNVALGLSKLGVSVLLAGRIAHDISGAYIEQACLDAGIDTRGLIYDETCATSTTFALIDERGERHFLTDKEIFSKLVESDIPENLIDEANIVYFGSAMALPGMNDGGLENLFRRAKAKGKRAVMDAAIDETKTEIDWLEMLAPTLRQTDIFFPSIGEARLITQKDTPEEIAACFSEFGMQAFGIKLGKQGCFITNFAESRYIPALWWMPVVDTTGAGDSFLAGLLCGLSQGWDIFRSTEFANTVAAQNVGAFGGTAGIQDFDAALRFFADWEQNHKGKTT
jgi:sugar/nucleoside kinase (ribokinase family)